MRDRPDIPHRTATELITGHFHEKRGYATFRTHGTRDYLLTYTVAGRGRFGYPKDETLEVLDEIPAETGGPGHAAAGGRCMITGVAGPKFRWEFLWTHFQPRLHWMEWLAWPEVAPGLHRLQLGGVGRAKERGGGSSNVFGRRIGFATGGAAAANGVCDGGAGANAACGATR